MNAPAAPVSAVGLRLLVAGAFLAWVLVMAALVWLIARTPHVIASWREADLALPGLTEFAIRVVDWMQLHWRMVAAGALVPLILLLVMRKAVVAVLAVGMIFSAGVVAGGLAVAFWLPEHQVRELRAFQRGHVPSNDAPAATESVLDQDAVER